MVKLPDVTYAYLDPISGSIILQALIAGVLTPDGGTVRIAQEGGDWRISGDSARLQVDPTLWSALASGRVAPDIAPAHVQFALLPEVARDQGRTLSVTWNEGSVRIGF